MFNHLWRALDCLFWLMPYVWCSERKMLKFSIQDTMEFLSYVSNVCLQSYLEWKLISLAVTLQCSVVWTVYLVYKHFSRGNKFTNSMITIIRIGRSDLNQHKFTIGLTDSPACLCHYKQESPEHYFLDCFLYLQERQALFSLIEHYVSKFKRMTKKNKLNIILVGLNIDNEEFVHLNTILTKAAQNFILKTKRFDI